MTIYDFTFAFHFYVLEKEMATHSSVLAWRIPGTEDPRGPATSTGSLASQRHPGKFPKVPASRLYIVTLLI